MEEQPSLWREMGKVAWFVAKILAAGSVAVALFAWLIFYHPVVGMIAFYCLVFAALVVFLGWENYKSKLRDLESRRKWEEIEKKCKRAS